MHAMPVDPATGLVATGFTRPDPVWPMMGASEDQTFSIHEYGFAEPRFAQALSARRSVYGGGSLRASAQRPPLC